MPIYAYKCTKCGHPFERLSSIEKRDEAICPKCGAEGKRTYQGKCAFGAKHCAGGSSCEGGASSGTSCGGNCAGCAGCGH